jgi:thioredoxin 1
MKQITTSEELSDFLGTSEVCVIKFGAEWCPPCKRLHSILEIVEKNGFAVAEIDLEEAPALVGFLKVDSVPTMVFFKAGQEYKRLIGLRKQKEIEGTLISGKETK